MIENNKIYNLDCIEGLKMMETNSVDLVVTSPPYNLNINYSDYSYMSYIGITPNKPYLVLDEKSKFEIKKIAGKRGELSKIGKQYQIQDDYFNKRWVDSFWFFELCELRDDRIDKLLD